MQDARPQMARGYHQQAKILAIQASLYRSERDRRVRELHGEGWSYGQLAKALGCSRSLIKQMVDRGEDEGNSEAPQDGGTIRP